jgi:hypothetical protein
MARELLPLAFRHFWVRLPAFLGAQSVRFDSRLIAIIRLAVLGLTCRDIPDELSELER